MFLMFSHVFVGVSDFERALLFYQPLMECLGHPQRFCERSRPWAGWQTSAEQARPLFLIGSPYNQQDHAVGNGQMVAFMVSTRAAVDEVHALALRLGGTCDGAPGLRPEYHAQYYGAYFRDPDGNKIGVVCHE